MIKKLKYMIQYHRFLYKHQRLPLNLPQLQYCLEGLALIRSDYFLHYYPEDGETIVLHTVFDSLNGYTQLFNNHLKTLKQHQELNANEFTLPTFTENLDFLLTRRGEYYIDVRKNIYNFVEVAQNFCQLLQVEPEKEQLIHQYNLRISSHILIQLGELVTILVHLTYKLSKR